MISFHNPKFHEKILKKYGRKIRKSYFSNLFFRQDFKSPVPGESQGFIRIKLDFHNTIIWKNFPLSSPEGKQQGNSVFPPKLKIPGLKKLDLTPKKPAANKPEQGNLEPERLTYHKPINPRLTAYDLQPATLASLEPVIPEFIPNNPVPANFEFTAYTLLKPINLKLKIHSPVPANLTFTNLTPLKLAFFGKNSTVPVSGTGNTIQNKRSYENFFSNRNSSFFTYSNLPAAPELIFQIKHLTTDFQAHASIPVLAESGLSRKIHNEALRKINELNLSGQDFLFSGDLPAKRPGPGTTEPGVSIERGRTASLSFPREQLNRILPFLQEQSFKEAGFKELSLKNLEQEKSRKEKTVQKELKFEKWIREELSQNKLSDRIIQVRTDRTEVRTEVQKEVNRQQIQEKQELKGISEKQELREIREKHSLKELIDYGEIPKTSFSNPIQFLIRNFLEKTSLLPYREYSTDPESSISHNIMPEQKTVLFPFSKKGSMQTLPAGGIFPAKGTGTKKTIPERFGKDLSILRKSLLHEDIPDIPGLYTRISSRLFTFITSPLLISKNGSLKIGLSRHESEGPATAHKRSTGSNRSKRIFPGSSSKIYLQYLQVITEMGDGVFEKILTSPIKEQNRNQQFVLELNPYLKPGPQSPGLKATRAFNWLRTFTHDTGTAFQLNQQAAHTPGGKAAFQLKQQVTHTPSNKDASQSDRQEIHKFGNAVFASHNQLATRTANRALIYALNRLGGLLPINKSTYTTATYTINSPAAIAREKKHPYRQTSNRQTSNRQTSNRQNWLQNTFHFQSTPLLSSTLMIEGWGTSNLPEMTVLLAYNSTATYTTRQPAVQAPVGIKARIFNSPMALTTNYPATNYLTPDYYKANNQKGLKREQQYPLPITRLQPIFNQSSFLKLLITAAYTFKHPESPLPGGTKNFTSNKTAAPTSGQKETSALTLSEKYTPHIAPIYTLMQPVARAFHYVETLIQRFPAIMAVNYIANYPFNYSATRTHNLRTATINYPIIYNYTQGAARRPLKLSNNYYSEKRNDLELSSLSLSFPGKETSMPRPDTGFLEHSRTVYSPSGTDTLAVPPYFITLRKIHNPVQAGSLSSRGLFSSRPESSKLSLSGLSLSGLSLSGLSSSKFFNSSVLLLSKTENKNPDQKAVPVSFWRNKSPEVYPGIRKLQQISSGFTLSGRPKSTLRTARTGLLSVPAIQKISGGREDIFKGMLFGFKGLPGFGKTEKAHPYAEQGDTDFTFSGVGAAGKNRGTSGAGAFGKERSELMHAGRSTPKNGREDLVYGTSQTLAEDVIKIKKVVFETKDALADHLVSHFPLATGKAEQVMDIEDMSEKIMQSINRRLKIEAERRGII